MAKLDEKVFERVKADILAGDTATVIAARYKIPKHRVWMARTAMKAEGIELPMPVPNTKRSDEVEPGARVATDETYLFGGEDCQTCTIYVPVSRLDWVLGNVTLDEAIAVLLELTEEDKGWAIQFLLQRRLQKIVESPATDELIDPIAIWRTTPEGGRVAWAPPAAHNPQPTQTGETDVA